jgi:hypothetical protein
MVSLAKMILMNSRFILTNKRTNFFLRVRDLTKLPLKFKICQKFKISQPKVINCQLIGDFWLANLKFLTDFKFKTRWEIGHKSTELRNNQVLQLFQKFEFYWLLPAKLIKWIGLLNQIKKMFCSLQLIICSCIKNSNSTHWVDFEFKR